MILGASGRIVVTHALKTASEEPLVEVEPITAPVPSNDKGRAKAAPKGKR